MNVNSTCTKEQVARCANSLRDDESIVAWVNSEKQAVIHANGKLCKTFQVVYRTTGEDALTKKEAKEIHIELCHKIQDFPGVEVRQIPR